MGIYSQSFTNYMLTLFVSHCFSFRPITFPSYIYCTMTLFPLFNFISLFVI
jgi:hypothetical protein